jgi:transposase-like protein
LNCPKCNSSRINKKGWSTSLIEPKQRYKCLDCGKRFVVSEVAEDESAAILLIDIETLPLKAYAWGTWDQNINIVQLISDWVVLSWSARWLDDTRIISDCLTPKEALARDDKRIIQGIWKLMDEADILVAQNGKRFDIPKINTRFLQYRMPPPSSYKIIDTLETAKKAFAITFNSLDYLGEFLGLGRKLHTDFQLWVDCDNGKKEALDRMREYNENDVDLLEAVYMRLRSWTPNHPKLTAYSKDKDACPVCGDASISYLGLYTANVRQYKEFRCLKCGSVWHNTKAEK